SFLLPNPIFLRLYLLKLTVRGNVAHAPPVLAAGSRQRYLDPHEVKRSYWKNGRMSPRLPRARAKNALLGGALLTFVVGVFAYALAAVKQDAFDDLDDAVHRAAMSAEDERRRCRWRGSMRRRGGGECAAVRAPTSMEKETPASTPRGVLPALLERRAPWLLDPTRKTLVRGEHSDSLWPPSSSPVFLAYSLALLPPFCLLYASLVIALVGALGSFLTVELAVPRTSSTYASLTASQALWALLALYLLAAAVVSFVEFFGVLWNKPSHVRLYRDCSAADLASTAFRTVTAARSATALCLPADVRAADVVYAPGSALERSAEVWVRAPPRRTRGCSTRAWCTASASGSEGPTCPVLRLVLA
ncbi:hypothetical protein FB451DRAFT_1496151, partial [Mycena latifolia]